MATAKVPQAPSSKSLLTTILISGLIVGTLDLTAACIQTLVYNGNLIRLFKYIATGVYGKKALEGSSSYAIQGILFHYGIAMIWTIIFFLVYPAISFLSKNRVLTGILYGLLVWCIMNRVVVPLSNTSKNPFNLSRALIAAGILIVAIGIPLSYRAFAYYKGAANSKFKLKRHTAIGCCWQLLLQINIQISPRSQPVPQLPLAASLPVPGAG